MVRVTLPLWFCTAKGVDFARNVECMLACVRAYIRAHDVRSCKYVRMMLCKHRSKMVIVTLRFGFKAIAVVTFSGCSFHEQNATPAALL